MPSERIDIKSICLTLITEFGPIRRDKLAAGIQRHYREDMGRDVKLETIKRAMRYAISDLLWEDGILVGWSEAGYYIVDSPEGKWSVAHKCRAAATALHERANRIMATALPGEPEQLLIDGVPWPDPHAYPAEECGEK